MIFVTVGTHEQAFDRLVRCVDELKGKGIIQEDVFIQTGFCKYEPKHCDWKQFISYDKMVQLVGEARIVITHGGPASFILAFQFRKVPLVVPRRAEFDEHVNNHQVEFVHLFYDMYKSIIPVDDISALENYICNYESICKEMNVNIVSNNENFNNEISKIVDSLF